jgi:hypothetical protein
MNLRLTAANLFSDTRLKGGQDIATEEPLEAPSQNSKKIKKHVLHQYDMSSLRKSNVAMGNLLSMEVLMRRSVMNDGFSIAMYDYPRVYSLTKKRRSVIDKSWTRT